MTCFGPSCFGRMDLPATSPAPASCEPAGGFFHQKGVVLRGQIGVLTITHVALTMKTRELNIKMRGLTWSLRSEH